jgi:hypothetical protein
MNLKHFLNSPDRAKLPTRFPSENQVLLFARALAPDFS